MWKWMSALSRTATCGRWRSALAPEQVYEIDKIKDVSRRAAEVGGVGDRYVCVIHGQETNLWMEKGRWFVEAKLVAEA